MSQAAALRGGRDGTRRPPPVPPSVHCVGARARLRGGPPHREPHAHAPGLGGLHTVSSVGFGVLALYPYYLVDNGGITVTMLKLSYLGEKSLFN